MNTVQSFFAQVMMSSAHKLGGGEVC